MLTELHGTEIFEETETKENKNLLIIKGINNSINIAIVTYACEGGGGQWFRVGQGRRAVVRIREKTEKKESLGAVSKRFYNYTRGGVFLSFLCSDSWKSPIYYLISLSGNRF